MIDFLVPTPFTIGFLLVPFFGLFLIKLSKYKKTGVTLIVIFLGFLLYVVLGFLLSWLTVSVLGAHPGGEALIP
jgi:hypothetical protein|tara:strand:+ start:235 stop:456 length:222 start_codon:yes stop_codon:yes gene_type:complete